MSELDGMDLDIHLHDTSSGIVAVLAGRGTGPAIVLRGDMDALDMPEDTGLDFAAPAGGMHACGHDLHTTMLIGAARLLSDRSTDLPGPVVFMFQPGEEGLHGARCMLEEGLLEVVDPRPARAFAIHVLTILPSGTVGLRPGPLMASADQVRVTVTGRGGHASMPHLAADPVPVACELVLAVETAVTRSIPVFDPAVVTFGVVSAGSAHNVIPESAFLHGTIRAMSEDTRGAVHELVARVAEGVASAHAMTVDVDIEKGYPVTVNDVAEYGRIKGLASALFGQDSVVEMAEPMMGAEDWSYVLEEVPGVMAFLGACPPELDPRTAPANHSNRVDFDERAMVQGVALYAAAALDQVVD
jgi:hippurate hydrolase